MCVAEYVGYDCGHCGIPYLIECPLTRANAIYPYCSQPAQRPIYANLNCHACSRVVWNERVLREEEEHKTLHLRGECSCEVIFDKEERERRGRTTDRKGKGSKGKTMVTFQEHGLDGNMNYGASSLAGMQVAAQDMQTENHYLGTGSDLDDAGYLVGSSEPQLAVHRHAFTAFDNRLDPSVMRRAQPGERGYGMVWYNTATLVPEGSADVPEIASMQMTAHTMAESSNGSLQVEQTQPAIVSSDMARGFGLGRPQPAITSTAMARVHSV